MLHSFTRDESVGKQKLTPGTVSRVFEYARPYKWQIVFFLILTVVDALIVVAVPLLLQRLIDDGVTPGNKTVVITVALIVAAIAVADAVLTLILRWYSSRIGEGLIYDMRSQVFDHVQRMPIAFFIRTQTGALISRLNSDVIGAQQAFTTTLSSVVSNVISLVVVTIAMLALSWQITLVALLMLPIFLIPARYVGRRLAKLTREAMQLNARDEFDDDRAVQRLGSAPGQALRSPDEEAAEFSGRARRVADIGIKIAMSNRIFFSSMVLVASLATALVYGIGGVLAINGTLTVGTLVALAALLSRLYGPLTALTNVRIDVMTALVSFERVFEVLDLPPMVSEKPAAALVPRGPEVRRLRSRGIQVPRCRRSLAGFAGDRGSHRSDGRRRSAARRHFRGAPRATRCAGRSVGCWQDHHHVSGVAAVRRHRWRDSTR